MAILSVRFLADDFIIYGASLGLLLFAGVPAFSTGPKWFLLNINTLFMV